MTLRTILRNIASPALLMLALLAVSADAATIYTQPTPDYIGATNVLTFPDPDEALLTTITDGFQTITFSSFMRASTVGANWASWGSPPATESSTPRVLWSGLDDNFDPVTTVILSLTVPATVFGFEIEPGPTDVHTITASFFNGGNLQGTITRDVSGDAGAVLFALASDGGLPYDSVVVSSDADWAAGQFRYAVPEPATWWSAGAALISLYAFSKRRSKSKS